MVTTHAAAVLLFAAVAAAQTPSFEPLERNHFSPDPGPTQAVVLADLDGDGHLDAVFLAQSSAGPSLLFYHNDGKAGFAAMTLPLPPLPAQMTTLYAGDIDGDGRVDLIVGTLVTGALILHNEGGLLFSLDPQSLLAGWVDIRGTLVDVDGDGDLDFLGWGSPYVTHGSYFLLRNDGHGHFVDDSLASFPPGVTPRMLHSAVADFDRDGFPDMIVAYGPFFAPCIDYLRNDGHGVYSVEPVSRNLSVSAIAVGDIDGDGYPDFLVTQMLTPSTVSAINDGSGHFRLDYQHPVRVRPQNSIQLLDINQNGRADLVLPDGTYYLNTGAIWSYHSLSMELPGGGSWCFGDLNGDLSPDLLGPGPHPRLLLSGTRVGVDRARLDATLRPTDLPTYLYDFRAIPDSHMAAVWQDESYPWRVPSLVLVNQGRLQQLSGPSLSLASSSGSPPPTAAFVYWTGDDGLVVADSASLRVFLSTGSSLTEQADALPPPIGSPTAVRCGQLYTHAPYAPDSVAVAIGSGSSRVLQVFTFYGMAYTSQVFVVPTAVARPDLDHELRFADFDGDGFVDVLCGARILRNDRNGGLIPADDLSLLLAPCSEILPFDMDGDGDADLFTSSGQLLESTVAGFRDVTLGRVPLGHTMHHLSAGDIDGDGDLDLMADWTVLRNDGSRFTPFFAVANTGMLVDLDGNGDADVFDGKQMWFNSHNRLHAPRLPMLGADYALHVTTWREGAPAVLAVIGISPGIEWTPVPGLPSPRISLGNAQLFALPLLGGRGALVEHLPSSTVLFGMQFFGQAATIDRNGHALATNLLAEEIR